MTRLEALEAFFGVFYGTAAQGAIVLTLVFEDGVARWDTMNVRSGVGVSHTVLKNKLVTSEWAVNFPVWA